MVRLPTPSLAHCDVTSLLSQYQSSCHSPLPSPSTTPNSHHPNLSLNLLMESRHRPHLIPLEDILPRNPSLLSPQNILMHTPLQPSPQTTGSPLSLSRNLQFHSSSNRFRDPKCTSQSFHFQGFLRFFPFLKAGFQGVGAVWYRGGRGRGGLGERGTNACAECVVQAGGGWSANCLGGEMGVGGGVARWRGDAHCLEDLLVVC